MSFHRVPTENSSKDGKRRGDEKQTDGRKDPGMSGDEHLLNGKRIKINSIREVAVLRKTMRGYVGLKNGPKQQIGSAYR